MFFTTDSYDEHGNLSLNTDPRGVAVVRQYDPADRTDPRTRSGG